MANDKSIDDIDDDEYSLSLSFLAAFAAFFRFLADTDKKFKFDEV